MNKLFILLGLIVISFHVTTENSFADSVATLDDRGYLNRNYSSSYNAQLSDSSYNQIAEAEEYLFGENYVGQSLISRIERLEDSIFGRRYTSSTTQQRVNNIIYNYNRTASSSNTTYKKTKMRNILDGFNQTFFGVPTGYTPPIYTDPYYNWNSGGRYGSYNNYYNRQRWRRYNSGIGSSSGVRIID